MAAPWGRRAGAEDHHRATRRRRRRRVCVSLQWLVLTVATGLLLFVIPAAGQRRDPASLLNGSADAGSSSRRRRHKSPRVSKRRRLLAGEDTPQDELGAQYCTGTRRSRDVIVYLGQKTHSSYDATHKNTLNASMESLRHNMKAIREADVIVWHEGDLEPADATALDGVTNVRFCLLTEATGWGPPAWLPVVPESKFSPGYRFMIRFYAVTIWRTLHRLGYQWVMRMDDDSFILSPIKYNVFADMRRSGLLYGYRMLSKECPTIFGDFIDAYIAHTEERLVGISEHDAQTTASTTESTSSFSSANGGRGGAGKTTSDDKGTAAAAAAQRNTDNNAPPPISPQHTLPESVETSTTLDDESKHIISFCGTWPRHCRKASMRDALTAALNKAHLLSGDGASFSSGERRIAAGASSSAASLNASNGRRVGARPLRDAAWAARERTERTKVRALAQWYCLGPGQLGYYNNWFVTSINWWLTNPKVTRVIAAFDRSNLIFTRRCNDLIFQTAAIKLFMPKTKRKRYTDFTYQHHTVSNGLVTFGGIESGYKDPKAMANLRAYLEKHIPESQRTKLDIETCAVQEVEDGELNEIYFISPASLRQRAEADAVAANTAVSRFESPYCGPDQKQYLT